MRFVLALSVLLAAGCDSETAEPAPIPYADAETKPVAVGGWAALAETFEYPEFAERANIGGTLAVRLVVPRAGGSPETGTVLIVRSPNDLLSEAALLGVREGEYEPGRVAGEPVAVEMAVCVTFEVGAPIEAEPCGD